MLGEVYSLLLDYGAYGGIWSFIVHLRFLANTAIMAIMATIPVPTRAKGGFEE
jgi:hypothetical protein